MLWAMRHNYLHWPRTSGAYQHLSLVIFLLNISKSNAKRQKVLQEVRDKYGQSNRMYFGTNYVVRRIGVFPNSRDDSTKSAIQFLQKNNKCTIQHRKTHGLQTGISQRLCTHNGFPTNLLWAPRVTIRRTRLAAASCGAMRNATRVACASKSSRCGRLRREHRRCLGGGTHKRNLRSACSNRLNKLSAHLVLHMCVGTRASKCIFCSNASFVTYVSSDARRAFGAAHVRSTAFFALPPLCEWFK